MVMRLPAMSKETKLTYLKKNIPCPASYTLYPTSHVQHPKSHPLHPTSYGLPYVLLLTSHILCPMSRVQCSASYVQRHMFRDLRPASYIPCNKFHLPCPVSYFLRPRPTSRVLHPALYVMYRVSPYDLLSMTSSMCSAPDL